MQPSLFKDWNQHNLVIARAARTLRRLPPMAHKKLRSPHCSTLVIRSTRLERQRTMALDYLDSDRFWCATGGSLQRVHSEIGWTLITVLAWWRHKSVGGQRVTQSLMNLWITMVFLEQPGSARQQWSTMQCSIVQYSAVHLSAVPVSALQYYAVPCSAV